MDAKAIRRLLAKWPAGLQLNLYLVNGYSVAVMRPDAIEDYTDTYIAGTESKGWPFAIPTSSIALMIYGRDKTEQAGKEHGGRTHHRN